MKERYRLGVDLGSTSLGWCMLKLDENNDPAGIINLGVRIFPDGREMKSHEPLAVKRRGYRGQRRNLDRYLERIRALISYLLENGFLPQDERQRSEVFQINPYYLRAKALDEQLEPAEFARALIHLAKRRGFRSNRKALGDSKTKLSEAIDNLKAQLAESGVRSLGEYMWELYQQTPEVKAHLRKPIKFRYEASPDNPNIIFPTREMVLSEFNAIWHAQAGFSDRYTEEHRQNIETLIFYQRPLLPTVKGKCQLLPEFDRAPKAHPLFQEFRIRQDLNNLKGINLFTNETFELSDDQYATLYQLLSSKAEVKFEAMRKALWGKQHGDFRFNFETDERAKLLGDQTHATLHKKGNEALAPLWDAWPLERKSKIIEVVISDLDDEPALVELTEAGIDPATAARLLELKLPDSYCHLSVEAMLRLLPLMRQRVIYSEACRQAGLDHSGEYNGEIFDAGDLPYYGEVLNRETIALNRKCGDAEADVHGRINNPSVHIALNQLRKVVNAITARYGAPEEIVLELGKDIKLGQEEKARLNKIIGQNRRENEKIDAMLAEHGLPVNHLNRLKVKLWWELGQDELDRRCVYTGHQISISDLFTHKIEIDHILPKSRTYEDNNANKILCLAPANRYKGERSPYEAFGQSRDGYDWQAIIARAENLKASKRWKFNSDAMDNFQDEAKILDRMLNDTRYMSRVAMKYMWYVCGNNRVWTITGRHTGMLRGKWGLNSALGEDDSKDRTDHRHHAIDAFVIALTTRGFIKALANNISNSRDRFVSELPPPWPGFSHDDFRAKLNSVSVSYKPDQISADKLSKRNQTGGALVEETAYGYAGPDPDNPKYHLFTVRKAVGELTPKNIKSVVRADLRRDLEDLASRYSDDDFKAAVKDWAARNNIKKVKLALSMNPAGMVPVRDKSGRAFKYMSSGENLFADIFLADPTDPNCKWGIEIVSSFHAHQPGFTPQWKKDHPKGKKIMRVFKNDVIALDGPGEERELRRVRKMTYGILYLRELKIAKKEKGKEDIGEQFSANQLQLKRAKKAGIDVIGRVFDPIVKEP